MFNPREIVKENFNAEDLLNKFLNNKNPQEDIMTGDIDGIFIDIGFRTFQNDVSRNIEMTSRRTQLGVEDNDHRFEKAKEVTLEMVFIDEITYATNSDLANRLLSRATGGATSLINPFRFVGDGLNQENKKDLYLTFLEYFNAKKKGTLVLMKKNRIFENMAIVSFNETEIYQDDGIAKVVQVTFREFRMGTTLNNLNDEVEEVTTTSSDSSQSMGNTNTLQLENTYKE